MNKYKLFLLFFFAVLQMTVYGENKIKEDGVYYSISGTSASVITRKSYDGIEDMYSGNVMIPDSICYDGKKYIVTNVCSFANCDELVSVRLPKNLSANPSFCGCSSLTNVENLCGNVGYIFEGCAKLSSISFSGSMGLVQNNVFNYCVNLKSVYVENLLSWLSIKSAIISGSESYGTLSYSFTSSPLQNGADLYVNGEKLTELVIPDTITSIAQYAFRGCSSIVKLTIRGNKTKINEGAFADCENLEEVNFYGNGWYGEDSFISCEKLQRVNFYGDWKVDVGGFYHSTPWAYCENLKSVRFNKEYVEADSYFESNPSCDNSTKKLFPYVSECIIADGTEKIGRGRFGDCDSLKTVYIPSTIRQTGNSPFSGCRKLKSVHIADVASLCNVQLGEEYYDYTYNGIKRKALPLSSSFFCNGSDMYVDNEKIVDLMIPQGVGKINEAVFAGCTSIETLHVSETVGRIGGNAFYGCKNLECVSLPSTLSSMGKEIFGNCERLTSIGPMHSNSSIEFEWKDSIPSNAFYGANYVKKLIIPSTIKKIGDYILGETHYSSFPKISEIYISAIVPPTISSHTFDGYSSAILYVPRNCKEIYGNDKNWGKFNIVELVDVEDVAIEKEKYDLIIGDSLKLNVQISPLEATYKDLCWIVENPAIVSVSNGIVRGLKTGTTKLIVKTTDGTNISDTCVVFVTNPVKGITLNKTVVNLEVGCCDTLVAYCLPKDADDTTIVWNSSNTKIAVVNNGIVQAVHVGETEITATSINGVIARCRVVVKPTLVTSVELKEKELQIISGKSVKLSVNVLPNSATNKGVVWESSNSQVATVDETGVVTGRSNGTAYILVKTIDGSNIEEKCTVNVTTLATSVSITNEAASLIVGQMLSLKASIEPTETSNKKLVWETNNPKCAIVSQDGVVSAVATGIAKITVRTTDGSNLSAYYEVSITNPVISVSLDKESAELFVGQSLKLMATCTPVDADNTNILWSSTNPNIAIVSDGIVTAKSIGRAFVIARSVNGKETKCEINVVPTPVKSLSLNKTELNLTKDKTYKLECTILPENATNKELTWKSDNEEVAIVDGNGIVTACSSGTANIIISAKFNETVKAHCTVYVTTPVTKIELSNSVLSMLVDEEYQLKPTVTPTTADNTRLKWSSSNAAVVAVTENGLLTANRNGVAVVYVETTDGSNLSASCVVTVEKSRQTLAWTNEFPLLRNGGELVEIGATASSGLPITYKTGDANVASIFKVGDVAYVNPVGVGKTSISAVSLGNYKYDYAELSKEVEIINAFSNVGKVLVAYYSKSQVVDGVVVELANQLANSSLNVNTVRVEPVNTRIDDANANDEVFDSIMNVINMNPNDDNSYPIIKPVAAQIDDYDVVIMVYPLWKSMMAAPMQTFERMYKISLRNKSVAYIEYELSQGSEVSPIRSNALLLSSGDREENKKRLKEWLDEKSSTWIGQIRGKTDREKSVIVDILGRQLKTVPEHGIYIENGRKIKR